MLEKTYGAAVQGIDASVVTIEVAVEAGIMFCLVGLADTAVKESYQRVLSAITQSGLKFPRARIVINMAPADSRKEGAAYDLMPGRSAGRCSRASCRSTGQCSPYAVCCPWPSRRANSATRE